VTKRVVVTGLGTVNSLGQNVNEYWTRLIAGENGISRIERFDASDMKAQIAGEMKNFDPSAVLNPKDAKRMSNFVQYAIVAATEAVKDSGINIEKDADNIGVYIGSGIGGIEVLENAKQTLLEKGASKISPFTVPMMINDMAAGQVSIFTGAKGPNACVTTACASGTTLSVMLLR